MSGDLAEYWQEGPQALRGSDYYRVPIARLAVAGVAAFHRLFLLIWQVRPLDLQPRFPLDDDAARGAYLGWLITSGSREYAALRELDDFWAELSGPASLPATAWSGGVSRLILALIQLRDDLGLSTRLEDEQAQRAALAWFFFGGGFRELPPGCLEIPFWQKTFLLDAAAIEDTRFARLLHGTRGDLQQAFDLTTAPGRTGYRQWLSSNGRQETALDALLGANRLAWPARSGSELQPFGVNLIGYAYGELGIGEDLRMAARALEAAGIPFVILNVSPGVDEGDRSVAAWVATAPRYRYNLFCLTALEHARVYLEQGSGLLAGRYTIGYWPWELQRWPAAWAHSFALVDEVWASSRYTETALSAIAAVPVCLMPMAVQVAPPEPRDLLRRRFDLVPGRYYFVFSFDGGSSFRRKNPVAVISAFQAAFAREDQTVGLVVKCMRADKEPAAWMQLQALAAADERIVLIDQVLAKGDVLALYAACDCFVSLHRAEGFGRGIAEALLLGLDVVASAAGGNQDFCTGVAGVELIPCAVVATGAADYLEGADNFWGEPSQPDAVQALRNRASARAGIRERGATLGGFAPDTVGRRYAARLLELDQQRR
ncbi:MULTISPECIES: glycosyltransferase [Pseudomonas]|uniref:glycosyltransferase n=1 Tax=Pseudomonas TaxID=286 RepID=UPI00037088F6|nr:MULTISPECIES: glycosyltransferase [Pseudomonas]MDC7828712.1 glycosyltransferase [Pseudomonas benzopyrenica]